MQISSLKFFNALFKVGFGSRKFLLSNLLLLASLLFESFSCFFKDACMFILGAIEEDSESLKFLAFTCFQRFKSFDFDSELVDNAPCNNLLPRDP